MCVCKSMVVHGCMDSWCNDVGLTLISSEETKWFGTEKNHSKSKENLLPFYSTNNIDFWIQMKKENWKKTKESTEFHV